MNATIDPDLVKAVQYDLIALKNSVDNLTSKVDDDEQKLQRALQDAVTALEELASRVLQIEDKLSKLQLEKEGMERRVTNLEQQKSSSDTKISYGNNNFFFYLNLHEEQLLTRRDQQTTNEADARPWLNFEFISLWNAVVIFLSLRANLEADTRW